MGESTFKCQETGKTFPCEASLNAFKAGRQKADQYLFKFYSEKIRPTEVRVVRRKRKSKRVVADEMPALQAIEPVKVRIFRNVKSH